MRQYPPADFLGDFFGVEFDLLLCPCGEGFEGVDQALPGALLNCRIARVGGCVIARRGVSVWAGLAN